eukprot:4500164-Alexandrium_andersonii.AAC.1
MSVAQIRKIIMSVPTKQSVFCIKHGRYCPVARCDEHISGVPCCDHSNMNRKKQGIAGPNNVTFFTWAAQRATKKEPSWTVENVMGFPIDELRRVLDRLYMIERVVTMPEEMGWRVARKR